MTTLPEISNALRSRRRKRIPQQPRRIISIAQQRPCRFPGQAGMGRVPFSAHANGNGRRGDRQPAGPAINPEAVWGFTA
jgi:hypothetical protein